MRMFVDHGPRIAGGLIGLSVDELRWGALAPGDDLHLEAEVLDKKPSRSQKPRGTVRVRVRTLGERSGEVQHMVATILVPMRPS